MIARVGHACIVLIGLPLVIAGCDGDREQRATTAPAASSPAPAHPGAADSTPMAHMSAPAGAPVPVHEGMQHDGQGRTPPAHAPQGAHAPGGHAAQPGDRAPAGAHAGMPGMERASPPSAVDGPTATLHALVSELMRDSAVQQRVLADSTLRSLWSSAGVRRILAGPPSPHD